MYLATPNPHGGPKSISLFVPVFHMFVQGGNCLQHGGGATVCGDCISCVWGFWGVTCVAARCILEWPRCPWFGEARRGNSVVWRTGIAEPRRALALPLNSRPTFTPVASARARAPP